MFLLKFTFILAIVLLLSASIDAKRKKQKSTYPSTKSKIKAKWSTSTNPGEGGINSMVASEEHSYYVKRTFVPLHNATAANLTGVQLQSPPYLAVPIVWFKCDGSEACRQGNSAAINTGQQTLSEGFLCDDDCVDAYAPICGKTPSEVAVFYNHCKLNVAKCRTHGLWSDVPYAECQQMYGKEVAYADMKFRASLFFRELNTTTTIAAATAKRTPQVHADEKAHKDEKVHTDEKAHTDEKVLEAALEALNNMGDELLEDDKSVDGASDKSVILPMETATIFTVD